MVAPIIGHSADGQPTYGQPVLVPGRTGTNALALLALVFGILGGLLAPVFGTLRWLRFDEPASRVAKWRSWVWCSVTFSWRGGSSFSWCPQPSSGQRFPAILRIDTARAAVRRCAWAAAGERSPDHDTTAENPLIIDPDATLVTAHSDKEHAAPNYMRGYGFHPLCAFVDHGDGGTGELPAMLLRPGNAGSNTAADHITIIKDALAQLPSDPGYRDGKVVLIRTVPRKREVPPGADGTLPKDFFRETPALIEYLTTRHLAYPIGFGSPTRWPPRSR